MPYSVRRQTLEHYPLSKRPESKVGTSSQSAGTVTSDVHAEKHRKENAGYDRNAGSPVVTHEAYKAELRSLQIELVKLQRHVISHGNKILIVLEGRDAAGKDGSIKRIVKYLSPRETRVVALGKPSDRDLTAWYFQRYVHFLPVAHELVLFNRSWYNRAGVEPVMGFCSTEEHEEFMQSVPTFEAMLVNSGIKF